MPTMEILARDIFLRHTAVDGSSHVVQHRVWDADRFIASQEAAAAKVNAEQKGETGRRAGVQQITQDQYRKERQK